MEEFLVRIQESINTIDGQLEFDDVIARIRKLEINPSNHETLKSLASDFVSGRVLTQAQAELLVQILIAWVTQTTTPSLLSDILDLTIIVIDSCGRTAGKLTDTMLKEMRLLELLIHEDAYVRYYSIQIIKKLSLFSSTRIAAAFLARPDILADLVDMARFSDMSEFVRNEAISLLLRLSADPHSAELHSVLVFQGLSDIIFELIIGEQEDELPAISSDAIDCLFRLCRNSQSSRYIRESGGCDRVSSYVAYAMSSVLDHARGIASEDDPETLQQRINRGWELADRMLQVGDLIISDFETSELKHIFVSNGLVSTLSICGESLFLSDEARAKCYAFISRLVTEQTANEFVEYEGKTSHLPFLWTLFSQLVDERTPLAVRASIDSIIFCVCKASPEAQQKLASMLGTSLASEDDSDPAIFYIGQSPGRTVSSVLSHAASEFVVDSILDGSALSEQAWFSLRALSHFVRSSVELQRSVLNVRISESYTVSQALVKLAKSKSGKVVMSGAVAAISEFSGSTTLGSVIMQDIELLKLLVDSTAKEGNKFSAVLLGLLVMLTDNQSSETLVSVIVRNEALGLPKLLKMIEEISLEKPKEIIKNLPTVPVGFPEFLAVHRPTLRTAILERYLGISSGGDGLKYERDALLLDQQQKIRALESELEDAKNDLFDLSNSLKSSDKQFVLRENAAMKSLLRQLQKEVKVNEEEITRVRKIHEMETSTLKRVIEDLQAQINALLLNNKQLSELHANGSHQTESQNSFGKDHSDLLELLKIISERFPETQSLMGPLGCVPQVALL